MADFEESVAGWKQAASILQANQKALEWALATIDVLARGAPEDRELAQRYHEARQASNTAQAYLASMQSAGAL